eukprot:5586385-Pleurochrysis_carterae.AAC.1
MQPGACRGRSSPSFLHFTSPAPATFGYVDKYQCGFLRSLNASPSSNRAWFEDRETRRAKLASVAALAFAFVVLCCSLPCMSISQPARFAVTRQYCQPLFKSVRPEISPLSQIRCPDLETTLVIS